MIRDQWEGKPIFRSKKRPWSILRLNWWNALHSNTVFKIYYILISDYQVEAALLSDPSNDELNKLKSDLDEVIRLTQELQSASGGSRRRDRERTVQSSSSASFKATSSVSSTKKDTDPVTGDSLDTFTVTDAPDDDFLNSILPGIPTGPTAPATSSSSSSQPPPPAAPVSWKAGDECYAPWNKDKK